MWVAGEGTRSMSREEIVRTSLRPLTSQDYFSVSEEWLTNDNHFCTRAIANRTSWLSYIDKRSVWLGGWLLNGPSFILCWMLASSGNVPYFAGRAKFLVHVFPRHCFLNFTQRTHQALICNICTFFLFYASICVFGFLFLVLAAWSGIFYGGTRFLSRPIRADCIDYDQLRTGLRREGAYVMMMEILPHFLRIPSTALR